MELEKEIGKLLVRKYAPVTEITDGGQAGHVENDEETIMKRP